MREDYKFDGELGDIKGKPSTVWVGTVRLVS